MWLHQTFHFQNRLTLLLCMSDSQGFHSSSTNNVLILLPKLHELVECILKIDWGQKIDEQRNARTCSHTCSYDCHQLEEKSKKKGMLSH